MTRILHFFDVLALVMIVLCSVAGIVSMVTGETEGMYGYAAVIIIALVWMWS